MRRIRIIDPLIGEGICYMKNNGPSLPDGWKRIQVKDICSKIDYGYTARANPALREPKFLRITDIQDGNVNWDETLGCEIDPETEKKKKLQSGDIVFARTGGTVGKSYLIVNPPRAVFASYLIRLQIREIATPEYVYHFFQSNDYWQQIGLNLRGGVQPNVNATRLGNLTLSLPPLSEQKRIAAILNDHMADIARARTATETQLEAAEALSVAYLREIFESKEAKQWPKVRLGDHASKIGSGVTPRGGQSAYKPEGIPLIRSQNIYLNRFVPNGLVFIDQEQDQKMRNSRVEKGDVLLNITGASIGRVCVVPDQICPANVNQHVSIIRTGILNPYYLSFYISNPVFQSFIMNSQSGATRQALTKNMIENFLIPCPPTKIQLKIVKDILHRIKISEKIITDLRMQMQTIDAIPSAVLNKAFNGEL